MGPRLLNPQEPGQSTLPATNTIPDPPTTPAERVMGMIFESRRRIATVLAILFSVLLGYHVILGHNGVTAYQQKRIEDKTLKQEIDALQAENARLKDHVDRLKDNPATIEHEAKERLHYTRPGEIIYTLNEKSSEPQTAPAPAK
jgi:cell division protein FtsB